MAEDEEVVAAATGQGQVTGRQLPKLSAGVIGRSRKYGRLKDEQEQEQEEGICDSGSDLAEAAVIDNLCITSVKVQDSSWDARETNGTSESYRNFCIHMTFAVFGAGSAWLVIAAFFMELPIYQERFGLVTSNRMTIGYNLGTLVLPAFSVARSLLRRCNRRMNYRALITGTAIANVATLLVASAGVGTLETLVALNFAAGSCGFLAGVVHQGYLITQCQNVYLASFWAGDAACGVLAAVLAMHQRPALPADGGRRFGPHVFFLVLVPLVPLSLVAFWGIDYWRLGALGEATTEAATPGAQASPSRGCDGGTPSTAAEMTSLKSADSPLGFRGGGGCLPSGVTAKPTATSWLVLVSFWCQFANWGIGDSIYPYACNEGSRFDGGDMCVFRATFGTVLAELLAQNLAACVAKPRMQSLVVPALVYTMAFPLLCLAAARGGAWASPHIDPASEGARGSFVVFLVVAMRLMGPLMKTLVSRLVQTEFDPPDWESMNFFLTCVSTASNGLGIAVATFLIAES
eukprot:TRINITY_DN10982_c0_g1_i1.p1 TRINITY_DN10982_c0_g1~~TRINITY_DN10982_c0_g1_i1.p1  ORF type:complete len:545 (-),score=90.10 TRINITY_DN10982_c0_g1_i1:32-1585(-)